MGSERKAEASMERIPGSMRCRMWSEVCSCLWKKTALAGDTAGSKGRGGSVPGASRIAAGQGSGRRGMKEEEAGGHRVEHLAVCIHGRHGRVGCRGGAP